MNSTGTIIDDTMLRKVWRALDANYNKGYLYRLSIFAEELKKVQPEISYSTYKNLLKKHYRRFRHQLFTNIMPSEFEQISKSFIRATNPSKVLIPCATGLECDFFSSNENVEYYFHDTDLKKATSIIININILDLEHAETQ